jgi:site-specific recombinase XerD
MSDSADPTRPPEDLSPRDAWKRYVDRRRSEATDHSLQTYHYRLKPFVQWCEQQGIESVGELTGWTFEEFETFRSSEGIARITLKGQMQTLKNWVEYLERIEAVEAGLSDRIHVPQPDESEESDDTQLRPDDAIELLSHFRATPAAYGARRHVVLELLWFTGARLGGLRTLDLRDYHADERFLDFVHRPKTDTPLKNGLDGQRPVGIPADVCDVVDAYVSSHRWQKQDENGRQPLITTRVGRITGATIRSDCYMATFPCHHSACPHGMDPETCSYKQRNHSSKCPSSRSPHQLRTGSIRWQLDIGIPPSVVAERVNASLKVIKKHYDKATPRERMESRRRRFVDQMDLSTDPTNPES